MKPIDTTALFRTLEEVCGGVPADFQEEIYKVRDWLTDERAKRPSGYMNDPRAFSGYMSYHFPLHLPELFWVLEQCRSNGLLGEAPQSILDIGCGPGTASLSAYFWFQSAADPTWKFPTHHVFADISKRTLDAARKLWASVSPTQPRFVRAEQGRGLGLPPNVKADWIFASHLLNEFGNGPRHRARKLLFLETLVKKHLNPGGLIFVIDPPLREPTMDLMGLRDLWVDDFDSLGLDILAPCPTGTKRCPMALNKRGWCYAQPPRTWARAAGLAPWDRGIEDLMDIEWSRPGFSYLVLADRPFRAEEPHKHMVRVSDDGTDQILVCQPNGIKARKTSTAKFRGAWAPVGEAPPGQQKP